MSITCSRDEKKCASDHCWASAEPPGACAFLDHNVTQDFAAFAFASALQPVRGSKERNKRRALQRFGLTGEDIDPPVDGVFRAMPAMEGMPEGHSSVTQARDGRWVASLNLGGELYQAFFVQQDDALEALNAAGYAVT